MKKLKIKLDKKINFNKGSRLQGFLMECLNESDNGNNFFDSNCSVKVTQAQIAGANQETVGAKLCEPNDNCKNLDSIHTSSEYIDFLHSMQYHPYTQFIENDNENSIWHINLLDANAEKKICPIFDKKRSIKFDNSEEEINIIDVEQIELSNQQLLLELSNTNPERYVKIKILTPISFKSYNNYYYFPNIRLIFNSIINRFNKFFIDFTLDGTDVLNEIEENFIMSDYNIKTKNFYLERVKIKGFVGDITFRFNGTMQLANIGNLLLKYGEFTGIGIKTSMGMGGFKIIKE